MTAPSQAPGGYESGAQALRHLVNLAQFLNVAYNTDARLKHALDEIGLAISVACNERVLAVEAIKYFAENDPLSLGHAPSSAVVGQAVQVDMGTTLLERDVAEVLAKMGGGQGT